LELSHGLVNGTWAWSFHHPRDAQRDGNKEAKRSLTTVRESKRAEKWCGNGSCRGVCEYEKRYQARHSQKKEGAFSLREF
jgi:hypothetical protein